MFAVRTGFSVGCVMGNQSVTLPFFCMRALLILLFCSFHSYCNAAESDNFNRSSFPLGFRFGAASAAYQVEGAAFEGGRGLSIWDIFSHTPGKIAGNSTGDVSVDQYHRYKEDIKLLKEMGMDSYRFSISWPRIFPNGAPRNGEVNADGVAYYNRLIDELLANGSNLRLIANNCLTLELHNHVVGTVIMIYYLVSDIQPYATLFHWDVPLALHLEYGGFLSENIVQDFAAFANTCFELFGDRIKHWITLNEPYTIALDGYDEGVHAPGRCSPYVQSTCLGGNSAVEPYTVAHHMLLAHAAAARIYKRKFQQIQNGNVGITLISAWVLPFNASSATDNAAAQRMLDFILGWFLDPLTVGSYPLTMRDYVGARLPKFTPSQAFELQASLDFLGINYYFSLYAADSPSISNPQEPRYLTDAGVNLSFYNASGHQIGKQASGAAWLHVYPRGIYDLLKYASSRFNKTIYVTENGYADANNSTGPIGHGQVGTFDSCNNTKQVIPELNDTDRLNYHRDHLYYVLQAIRDGADVRGYFAWTLVDNFEWSFGYTSRFGLYYIDFYDNLKRYAKHSVCWFKSILNNNSTGR